jgi:hypothetical protein
VVLIAPILIGLAPLVAWLLLYGLRHSWATILKAIKHYLTSPGLLQRIADPFGISAQPRVHRGEETLASESQAAAPATAGFLSHLALVIEHWAFTGAYVAERALAALYALRHAVLPKAIKAHTATTTTIAHRTARLTRAQALRAAHGNAALAHELVIENRLALRAQATAERALALAGAATIPVARPFPLTVPVTWLGDTWRSLRRRMSRVETLVGAGVLTALGLRVLARHLPWYRCTNVNRAMRQLCRTPHHFVDDLLGLFADFFILTNVCRVIPWLEAAFEEVATPLIGKLARVGAGLCNASYARGAALDVPALHLPPFAADSLHLP